MLSIMETTLSVKGLVIEITPELQMFDSQMFDSQMLGSQMLDRNLASKRLRLFVFALQSPS